MHQRPISDIFITLLLYDTPDHDTLALPPLKSRTNARNQDHVTMDLVAHVSSVRSQLPTLNVPHRPIPSWATEGLCQHHSERLIMTAATCEPLVQFSDR